MSIFYSLFVKEQIKQNRKMSTIQCIFKQKQQTKEAQDTI